MPKTDRYSKPRFYANFALLFFRRNKSNAELAVFYGEAKAIDCAILIIGLGIGGSLIGGAFGLGPGAIMGGIFGAAVGAAFCLA